MSDNVAESPGLLPYGSNVGAPAIRPDNINLWKNRGIIQVNNQLSTKFEELKEEYLKLVEEYRWNELVYKSKFNFEPIIGKHYYLYIGNDGEPFLSLIEPNQWSRQHLGSFKLSSEQKWIKI